MNNCAHNHLTIPRLPGLDSLERTDDIRSLLDSAGARSDISYVNWPADFPYRPLTTFTMAVSDKYIWVDFLVRCNYLKAEHFKDQSAVCEDSCVEFFIAPKDDGYYYNFEFNCIGAINASRRRSRTESQHLSSDDLATIRRWGSVGTRPFCELEGLFTWSMLVAIPLELIGLDKDALPAAFKANLYKCANTTQPHFLSWSPIDTPKPDFHRPEFFGTIAIES